MKEQFFNDLMARLSDKLSDENLQIVSKELTSVIDNYDIAKKSTEIVLYNYTPECAKTYLAIRKIEGVKKSSLNLYWLRLNQFFAMTRIPIEKVTPNDVRLWLYNLQNESKKGMSDRTLDGARTIICTFFKWANSEGYITTNPCANIKPIKYNARERQSLSEDELEAIRNACSNKRDIAMIEFMYSTGCRVSELINVKTSDIDFSKGEVTLFGKGEKYRQSYINAKAKLSIQNYLKSRKDNSPYLFVNLRSGSKPQLTKSAIELIVHNLGIKAGLKRNIHPHLIRHTTATLGLQRGMNITEIQKMLGHTNIETTLVYARTSKEAVKDSHHKFIV